MYDHQDIITKIKNKIDDTICNLDDNNFNYAGRDLAEISGLIEALEIMIKDSKQKEDKEDNVNLFWDDATDKLGIGTATPRKRGEK